MPTEHNEIEVNNHDVSGICNRVSRFATEVYKSASSQVNRMSQADQTRLSSYLTALKLYKAWVVDQPELDLPESSPRVIKVRDPFPAFDHVDNEDANDLLQQLWLIYNEMGNSQSARMPSSLQIHDANRFDAIVAKAEAFLANYIQQATPLDMPESSPHADSSGHGSTGI